MDKSQAINTFWNSFGIPAYDEYTVPDGVGMPYITFEASTDAIGIDVPMTASIWYRDSSWEAINKKADQISERISYSYYIKAIEGGYMVVKRGNIFAQRLNDPDDSDVRRILISVLVEFLTEN
jgi:hypothetical protein